jgi:hypothetical protein
MIQVYIPHQTHELLRRHGHNDLSTGRRHLANLVSRFCCFGIGRTFRVCRDSGLLATSDCSSRLCRKGKRKSLCTYVHRLLIYRTAQDAHRPSAPISLPRTDLDHPFPLILPYPKPVSIFYKELFTSLVYRDRRACFSASPPPIHILGWWGRISCWMGSSRPHLVIV